MKEQQTEPKIARVALEVVEYRPIGGGRPKRMHKFICLECYDSGRRVGARKLPVFSDWGRLLIHVNRQHPWDFIEICSYGIINRPER